MKRALNLGRLAGIKVFVHWTFLLIIGYIIVVGVREGLDIIGIIFMVILLFAIFGCVTLHELGHALAARRYGIDTIDITLLPIGGVARLENIPEKPKEELVVAIAGPMVNVVIAAVLLPIYLLLSEHDLALSTLNALPFNFLTFIGTLIWVNVMLIVFNAIPAFPMDGGRVLRALLAMRMNRLKATNIAARVGQFIAVLFIIQGITGAFSFLGIAQNPFLILIGAFVYFGAMSENQMVSNSFFLDGFKVQDVMRTRFSPLQITDTLQDAQRELLAGADSNFIVLNNGAVAGVLLHKDILAALASTPEGPIAPLIQQDILILKTEQAIKQVYMMMQEKQFQLLPVFENEQFVGVIDMPNLQEFIRIQSAKRQ